MALAVLDGNQTATTLSSIITGGEHIVAHSVISLGSNAIANITSAVSGSVITVPRLENIVASVATEGAADATVSFVKIGGHQDGSNQIAHIVHVSAGGAMKVDASGSSVTFGQAPVTFGAVTGNVSVLNFPSTQTIAGTVTANVPALMSSAVIGASSIAVVGQNQTSPNPTHGIQIGYISDISGTFVNVMDDGYQQLPVKGTVTIGSCVTHGVTVANSVTIGAMPSGALTTRFGSVTTANTAQITSAVTNTSRKYLLAQNISAGTVTIGIGFSPTTTQGIQLTAGAGLTFDAFAPTGAVYWLGAVTGAAWTILEG